MEATAPVNEWRLKLQGGAYDGWVGTLRVDPPDVIVVWVCGSDCDGHATVDPHDPSIVLRTAESYRRVEVDLDERLAVYAVGEGDPSTWREERELVGAGAGDLGSGWPVSP